MITNNEVKKSWQTTVYGVLAGLLIVVNQLVFLFDGNPETNLSFEELSTALSAIFLTLGLIKARDHHVSSENANEKQTP